MSLTGNTSANSQKNDLPDAERKRLLGKVHAAKKQLGLSDEEYRSILRQTADVDSAKYLDLAGFKKVVAKFRQMGFKAIPSSRQKSNKEQKDKIRALWIELHETGKVRDRSDTALNHFVRNRFKVERIEWLSPKQAGTVIESLKKWLAR